MTLTAVVSDPIQLLKIIPHEYEVFGGLGVDHHSIAAIFTDHETLMQSLRLPYSAAVAQLVSQHFPGQRLAAA